MTQRDENATARNAVAALHRVRPDLAGPDCECAACVEPIAADDKLLVVRIKASDWEALTGDGMPLPAPSRLQLVKQPGETAGGLTTYGMRLVGSS